MTEHADTTSSAEGTACTVPRIGAGLPAGSALRQFAEERYSPRALDRLASHLTSRYGIDVAEAVELDLGVLRIDRHDGPRWVARVFPPSRPPERSAGDAAILRALTARGPGDLDGDLAGEHLPVEAPLSELDGQAVLVTEFVESVTRAERAGAISAAGGLRRLGEVLGRLQALSHGEPGDLRHPSDALDSLDRPGGCWHHLADGGPDEEVRSLAALLDEASALVPAGEAAGYDTLRELIGTLDDAEALPMAFAHPDFVMSNVVPSPVRGLVLVDWTGAGQAARIWPLAWFLFTEGVKDLRRIDRILAGYGPHVTLGPAELDRLGAVMLVRPLVLAVWSFCMGRSSLGEVLARSTEIRRRADEVSARAVAAFAAGR
ncbi:MAG TPA: phosphotransferase [Acidimicrobiales bacterium]|nr:phosphotransferase [Acidimicrobiales bacterium]